MKIMLAKTAGFCMGVRRAVEMVLEAPSRHERPIYTYGPLIHNPQVLHLLEEKGISILKGIPEHGKGTVLIRAHGVPPTIKVRLRDAGFTVIDATCPRVIKVQTIIKVHAKQGYEVIIIGDRDHPEVIGLLGYAGDHGYVIGAMEELKQLPAFDKAILVAQTTQNTAFFDKIKSYIQESHPHYKIADTICDSTEKRQAEVRKLAESVDAVVVVGGKNSGNTQRLAEIAVQSGKPVYHVESENELDVNALQSARSLAITAGASTPNWVIKKVYRNLETLPFSARSGWRLFFSIQRTLLLTNIYVAIGAGCLCYACTTLQRIPNYGAPVLISMVYVLSMHILNNLTGTREDRYNDPDRALFYDTNQQLLSALAVIAGGTGLIAAYTMGRLPFLLLFAMSLLGLSYKLRILPKQLSRSRYQSLKDIPGSKTILISVAWGLVTSVFPYLAQPRSSQMSAVLVFLWSASMVFVRTAFFDMLDVQGDRIVGKETLPIILGEQQTMKVLKLMLLSLIVILLFSGALGLIPSAGLALTACPIALMGLLLAYRRGWMLPGTRLEFLIESHFVMAGMIAWIMNC